MSAHPFRSVLYMPASNARALEKAASLPADALILDLEDAVAPDKKSDARILLSKKLSTKPYGNKKVIIRVNDLDTEWFEDDLACAIACKPDAILIPKINKADDVIFVSDKMTTLGAPQSIKLWIMVETALSLLNIFQISKLAKFTRLDGFVMGVNDLAKEMQIPLATPEYPDRLGFLNYFSSCILAARLNNICILDGVFNNFSDDVGVAYEANQAKQLGFDGKTLIHPKQIDIANTVFAPTEAELKFAHSVVAAFADPANLGLAAIKVDGKMVEILHLDMAKNTLAKVRIIDELSAN
ncbi:MAG: CoA ester lyase [Rhizobiales bacterium]|nr:CoA ester lyase [Hyphomicrobiales bacterium]